MFWLYSIALMLCSLIIYPPMLDWAREPKEFFLLAFLVSIIVYLGWKKNKVLASFIAWVLLGMWWNQNLLIHACAITPNMNPVFDLWVNSIALFIVGIGIWYLVVQRLNTKKLCEFICLGVSLQAGFGLYQAFTGYLCVGTVGNQSVFNEFLAICLPLFLLIEKKYIRYLGMGLVLLAILVSKPIQTGNIGVGTLALIPGGLFLIWHKAYGAKPRRAFIPVVLFICFMFIYGILISPYHRGISDSFSVRTSFWKDSIIYGLKGNQITGWGLGNYKQVMTRVKTSQHTGLEGKLYEAHNEYIQIWFETGIIGLLLVIVFLGNIARRCFYDIKQKIPLITAFIMILFISVLSFPFHVASTAFISVTIIFLLEKDLTLNIY